MIIVVDYGMGNLRSVSKALEHLRAEVCVTSDPREIDRATKLILPGVGAFGAAMEELRNRQLLEPIKTVISRRAPYLGICLGLQLLFDESEESPGVKGLGILRGKVKRFSFDSSRMPGPPGAPAGAGTSRRWRDPADRRWHHSSLKIPHMGWNQVVGRADGCPVLRGISEGSYVYFVHSYYADPANRSLVVLESEYGIRFTAMVWRDNLFATQFHPEKSQTLGLRLLQNFVNL